MEKPNNKSGNSNRRVNSKANLSKSKSNKSASISNKDSPSELPLLDEDERLELIAEFNRVYAEILSQSGEDVLKEEELLKKRIEGYEHKLARIDPFKNKKSAARLNTLKYQIERSLFRLRNGRNPFPFEEFNFDDEKRIADNLSSVEKKLQYWINIKEEYRRFVQCSDDDHLRLRGRKPPIDQSLKYMAGLNREIFRLKNVIDIENQDRRNERLHNEKKYIHLLWFKIGLLFATGQMNDLLTKHNNNATQMAKELGNKKGYRPYISATLNNNNSDKNIYSSLSKMEKINDHCKAQGIETTPQFKGKLILLQSK